MGCDPVPDVPFRFFLENDDGCDPESGKDFRTSFFQNGKVAVHVLSDTDNIPNR